MKRVAKISRSGGPKVGKVEGTQLDTVAIPQAQEVPTEK